MTVLLTFACGLYDRTLALYTGDVKPEGIDLTYEVEDNPRSIFDTMAGDHAFDASELSASEFICRRAVNQCPFVAIPVFPSRLFRHSFIVVNRRSGIRAPKDLEGKRIGTPVYTSTAMVYIRAMLQHDYGVDLSTIRWVEGDIVKPGRATDVALPPLLKPVTIERNKADKGLSQLLEEGALDAICGTPLPPCLGRHPDIERLFPNFRDVEIDYYRRTKIFPIMHMVAIRRDLHERHPFVAASLYKALCTAKNQAMDKLLRKGAPLSMLPWARAEAESMQQLFGDDIWPYGVDANRTTLEAFVGYLAEQGMISAPLAVDDLFVKV